MAQLSKKVEMFISISILVFSVFVSEFLIPTAKVESGQDFSQTEIPVVIKPLKTDNGIVPVEIQCGKVLTAQPDTLDFTCYLINNTDKSIGAASVGYAVVYDSNGEEKRNSRSNATVPYIHPDLLDVKKPVEPGGKLSVMPHGSITEPGSVIKRLELEPLYLEFTDGTIVGVGGKDAELIARIREGATKYRNLLRREYLNKRKSSESILPLLEDEKPISSEIVGFAERAGATAYRRWLRKKYEKNGVSGLTETLEQ